MKMSQLIKAIAKETAGKFDFVLIGQQIVGFRTSKRANRSTRYSPLQALYAVRFGRAASRPRTVAARLGVSVQNVKDVHAGSQRTCQQSSRWGSRRRRVARNVLMKTLGIDAGWCISETQALIPELRDAIVKQLRESPRYPTPEQD